MFSLAEGFFNPFTTQFCLNFNADKPAGRHDT